MFMFNRVDGLHPARRLISGLTAFVFIFSMLCPPLAGAAPAQLLGLPAPGAMVLKTRAFAPALIRGVRIDPDNPLAFNFIIDTGDSRLNGPDLKAEAGRMIKYFLAALTVPEDQIWVNLSPYEGNRIVGESLGRTEMGRDLLAQDYLLKQLSASLLSPDESTGRDYWQRVYQRARDLFGTTNVPVDTFNKIWIVPQEAVVYEDEQGAYVGRNHLKVMLEADYLALEANLKGAGPAVTDDARAEARETAQVTADVVREVLLPEIEREVNEGETFANLRQMYHAMILATWYKTALKESLLGRVYANQNKTRGVDLEDPSERQAIYDQYLEAFRVGVYDAIKEDLDPVTKEVLPRRYFSGGFGGTLSSAVQIQRFSRSSSRIAGELASSSPASEIFEAETNLLDVGPNSSPAKDLNALVAAVPTQISSSPVRPGGYSFAGTLDEIQGRLWNGGRGNLMYRTFQGRPTDGRRKRLQELFEEINARLQEFLEKAAALDETARQALPDKEQKWLTAWEENAAPFPVIASQMAEMRALLATAPLNDSLLPRLTRLRLWLAERRFYNLSGGVEAITFDRRGRPLSEGEEKRLDDLDTKLVAYRQKLDTFPDPSNSGAFKNEAAASQAFNIMREDLLSRAERVQQSIQEAKAWSSRGASSPVLGAQDKDSRGPIMVVGLGEAVAQRIHKIPGLNEEVLRFMSPSEAAARLELFPQRSLIVARETPEAQELAARFPAHEFLLVRGKNQGPSWVQPNTQVVSAQDVVNAVRAYIAKPTEEQPPSSSPARILVVAEREKNNPIIAALKNNGHDVQVVAFLDEDATLLSDAATRFDLVVAPSDKPGEWLLSPISAVDPDSAEPMPGRILNAKMSVKVVNEQVEGLMEEILQAAAPEKDAKILAALEALADKGEWEEDSPVEPLKAEEQREALAGARILLVFSPPVSPGRGNFMHLVRGFMEDSGAEVEVVMGLEAARALDEQERLSFSLALVDDSVFLNDAMSHTVTAIEKIIGRTPKILLSGGRPDQEVSGFDNRGFVKVLDSHASNIVDDLLESSARAILAQQAVVSSPVNNRILMVDDSITMRDDFVEIVGDEVPGVQVDTAENGADALAKIQALKAQGIEYDMIITDREMPEMDGLALAQAAREDGFKGSLILISGFLPDGYREEHGELFTMMFAKRDLFSLVRAIPGLLPQQEEAPTGVSSPVSRRILLVDDDEGFRNIRAEILKSSLPGMEVLTADGGETALAMMKEEQLDLIVTDRNMPGMDGVQFARAARAGGFEGPLLLNSAESMDDITGDDRAAFSGLFRKSKRDQIIARIKALLPDAEAPSSSPVDGKQEVGGIDLDAGLLDLQIKRDGRGVPFPLSQQPIESMHIEGFIPVILNITPLPSLPMLLGMATGAHDEGNTAAGTARDQLLGREPEELSLVR